MKILIIAPNNVIDNWVGVFNKLISKDSIVIWPNALDYDKIDCVALWNQPHGLLNKFKNFESSLECILPTYNLNCLFSDLVNDLTKTNKLSFTSLVIVLYFYLKYWLLIH